MMGIEPSTPWNDSHGSDLRDLAKVRALCLRLAYPHWMPRPASWIWLRPDGMPQGFGPLASDHPGLANLLWLSMDMVSPPRSYATSTNGLYQLLLADGASAMLSGAPLLDIAGMVPLPEFALMLPPVARSTHPVEAAYPLLRMLAERRLHRA